MTHTQATTEHAILRYHSEQAFAAELLELAAQDTYRKPPNWQLSPWAVATYLLGGKLPNGFNVSPKYIGDKRVIEVAIATLATDRALLLLGVPGTAKTWVSEHLAAAICGQSTLIVQGTAGTAEEAIRYGWNYARLLAEGPSANALVASPVMRAMQAGKIARVEELTRIPADVQDALITILSEKSMPIPELNTEVQAIKGFNIIATANDRDKGVNELSSALKRRFNTVVLPVPDSLEQELEIVKQRVQSLGQALDLPTETLAMDKVKQVVTIFRELRQGQSLDGKIKLKKPSGSLSTAEVISVLNHSLSLAAYFGSGDLQDPDLASSLIGAVVKDPVQDRLIWKEYLETVLRERNDWHGLYQACREQS